MSGTVPIEEFVAGLRKFAAEDFEDVAKIHAYVRAHPVTAESLAPYLSWDGQHYTRNLIERNDCYELIAICWEPGQVSAIHNHHGQHCWMSAPIGRLRVQNYRVLDEDATAGRCELEESDTEVIAPGNPVAVDPAAPVHRVDNPREWGEGAVSLHIYSDPIDRCVVYSKEKRTCGWTDLHYTTMYGKKAGQPA